jgi:hypothetical protein
MYLAAKLSKFEVKDWHNRLPNHVSWWDQFAEDLEASDLEEICHQVLDLYNPPQLANLATPIAQTNGKTPSKNPPTRNVTAPTLSSSSRPAGPKTPPPRSSRNRTPPMPPQPVSLPRSQARTPPNHPNGLRTSQPRTPPMPPNGLPPTPRSRARTPPLPPAATRPPLPPPGVMTLAPVAVAPPAGYPPGMPPAPYYYPPNYPPQIVHPHYSQAYPTYPVPPGQVFYPGAPPPHPPPPEGYAQPPPSFHGNVRY